MNPSRIKKFQKDKMIKFSWSSAQNSVFLYFGLLTLAENHESLKIEIIPDFGAIFYFLVKFMGSQRTSGKNDRWCWL